MADLIELKSFLDDLDKEASMSGRRALVSDCDGNIQQYSHSEIDAGELRVSYKGARSADRFETQIDDDCPVNINRTTWVMRCRDVDDESFSVFIE